MIKFLGPLWQPYTILLDRRNLISFQNKTTLCLYEEQIPGLSSFKREMTLHSFVQKIRKPLTLFPGKLSS